MALGVLGGAALLVVFIWVLTRTLGTSTRAVFGGKPIEYWQAQLNGQEVGASNAAFVMANTRIIPELTDAMFRDTNDSRLRISLIDTLNQLPGVHIYFLDADGRRIEAAQTIGALGPAAKSAIPALLQALKGNDAAVHGAAISALGEIHSEPETIIPLLITYLDNDNVNAQAATALGNYGALAKAAVPRIVPMLHVPDKDARVASAGALLKIDPEAYTNATLASQAPPGNGPAAPH